MAWMVLSRVATGVTVAVVAHLAYENKDWIKTQINRLIVWIQSQFYLQPVLVASDLCEASEQIDDKDAGVLLCPISHQLMLDAVVTPYGHCFDRSAIESWLRREETCPITRQPLSVKDLKDCPTMRLAVRQYIQLRTAMKEK